MYVCPLNRDIYIYIYMNNNLIWASPLIVKGSVNGLLYHRKSVCEGKLHFVYILTFHFPENDILTQSTVPENITTINEGDNVTIACKVSGNGIKRVEWYKDKIEIPSRYNNTGDFNVSIADLTAVTVSQAGEYECRTSIIPTPYFGYQAESFLLQVIGKVDLLFNLVDYTKWVLVTVYPNTTRRSELLWTSSGRVCGLQGPLVRKLDNTIHWINLYPVDNTIGFPNTYPLDSDLSGG